MDAPTQIRQNLDASKRAFVESLTPGQRLLHEYISSTEAILATYSQTANGGPRRSGRNGASPIGGTRSALLKRLDTTEYRQVSVLASDLGKTFSATSAALRGLKRMGLVEGGGRRGYRLAPPGGAQEEEMDSEANQPYSAGSGLSQGETAVAAVVSPTTSS
jgi:DNA-binding transcriptional ArsR family regulator